LPAIRDGQSAQRIRGGAAGRALPERARNPSQGDLGVRQVVPTARDQQIAIKLNIVHSRLMLLAWFL
jgi:hypothetical protein